MTLLHHIPNHATCFLKTIRSIEPGDHNT